MFLQSGGEAEWLTNPAKIPQKFKAVNAMNIMMAHSPWNIRVDHIRALLKPSRHNWGGAHIANGSNGHGNGNYDASDVEADLRAVRWSIPELLS